MKYYYRIMISLVFLLAAALPVAAQTETTVATLQSEAPKTDAPQSAVPKVEPRAANEVGSDYLIGPGDVLDVSVWKEDALTRTVTVRPDGKISFPLIGEVQAAGQTLAALKGEIAKRMVKYAPNEEILLDIRQINSVVVYVIGRVNQPGRFALNANINVLQALSMAGGLNPFAKRNEIKIYRTEAGSANVLNFSYDDVTERDNLDQNIILKRGDVVVVP